MKKTKDKKEKLPSIFKFMKSKELLMFLIFFILGTGGAAGFSFVYEKITNGWITFSTLAVIILFFFISAIFIIFAIVKASIKRGSEFYGNDRLIESA